jgi:metacaspase-1
LSDRDAPITTAHALIVAVANYKHINALPEAVLNDARDVAKVLTSSCYCGYAPENVRLLLDNEATADSIREGLCTLGRLVRPEDTALIFFSGHGGLLGSPSEPTSALLPVDYDPTAPEKTSLVEAELTKVLQAIRADRLVVMLDACHSGGAGNLKQTELAPRFGFTEKAINNLSQGKGRVIIASSRSDETSLIFTGMRNSLFSAKLLEALKGKGYRRGDGLIRIFDVFNHVSEKVRAEAPNQHPIFKAHNLEDNFALALDRGGQKGPVVATADSTTAAPASDDWKRLENAFADLYPIGPTDQQIWSRAGGDISRLQLGSTGRAAWYGSLRTLRQGGGGAGITRASLVAAALEDYPHHPELTNLRQ